MKTTTRKLLITSMLVATTSITSVASAEGFLSSLLGGGSKAGVDFKSMLSHVPADTPYMFANKNPIPKDVMDFHLNRSQEMMDMIAKMDQSSAADQAANNDGSEALFKALLEELGNKFSAGKIEETGLSLKARYLVYSYDVMPVLRLSFADKDKLMDTLKRAEKKSGQKAELTKCGDYDCFLHSDEKKEKSVAIVILDNQIAASVFPIASKGKMIDHLIGKADPKESYSENVWDSFLKENSYAGYGEGFVNLLKLYSNNTDLIHQTIKENNKNASSVEGDIKLNGDKLERMFSEENAEPCLAVVKDHLENVPEIIFGTKNIKEKNMDYEIVVKTSSTVSSALQSIANKTNIAQRIENAIFDIGVNINFLQLRNALTQYSNFLIASGEKHKCSSVNKNDIRKGMGGMAMAMNMGLSQFNSLYFSVADVELDKKMQPKKVDAYISLGTNDPNGVIGMVGMFSPALMGFKVPTDGTTVKLPKGAVPSRGLPVPEIFLNRTKDTLNIMVGNDKPKLKEYKKDTPEILSFSMDGKRYYEKFSQIMKAMPQTKGEDQEQVSKMMESIGKMSGTTQQEVTADKRGLIINYHIQY